MFSDPFRRQFMSLINQYFQSPIMQKIKNNENRSVYMCRINTLLLKDRRFLIAISPIDNHPIGHKSPLKDILWDFFQIRVLDSEEYIQQNIISHSYIPKNDQHLMMIVSRYFKNKEYSLYRPDQQIFPIEITLLNTIADEFEYPEKGTIISCIETFQTIIQFTTSSS